MLPLGREIALTTSLKTSTLCWYSRLSFKNFTSPPNPASSYIQHNGKKNGFRVKSLSHNGPQNKAVKVA